MGNYLEFLEEDLPPMQFLRITDSIEAHRSISTPINPTEEAVRSFTNDLIKKLESETAVKEMDKQRQLQQEKKKELCKQVTELKKECEKWGIDIYGLIQSNFIRLNGNCVL